MISESSKIIQAIGTLLIGIALMVGVVAGVSSLPGIEGRTISVTGKAVRNISPNQSVVGGSWEDTANTTDAARNKVKAKTSKALDALKAAGISEKKITTTQISVYPNYDYPTISTGTRATEQNGYKASTSLEVKLDDVKKADQIISLMTQNQASSTSGPTLGLTTATRDQLEKELKLEAVTQANTQAKALAKQAGGRLGKVISVSGGGIDSGYPVPMMADSVSSSKSAPSGGTDISVGEKEITVTVSVSYRLK